jgi:hypothetical protein
VFFYGSQAHTGPLISPSSGLNRRFNASSAKEGFAIAIADLAAPAAHVGSASYPVSASVSGGSIAITAQAVLLH